MSLTVRNSRNPGGLICLRLALSGVNERPIIESTAAGAQHRLVSLFILLMLSSAAAWAQPAFQIGLPVAGAHPCWTTDRDHVVRRESLKGIRF
jgi:hypothetical protein